MKGFAERKVPGGKFFEIDSKFGTKIIKVKISGDFFIHPEESITNIEDWFIGKAINELRSKMLINSFNKWVQSQKITLIGFTSQDIIEVILESLE